MGGALMLAPQHNRWGCKLLSHEAKESCFPYGVVRRIRFDGFWNGSRSTLSPAPRTLLNEVDGRTNTVSGADQLYLLKRARR